MPKRRVVIPDCSEPGIYAIQDHAGRRYIGSSLRVGARWSSHVAELRAGIHHNYRLQSAWDSFGEDTFSFLLLEGCEPADLVRAEQKWIDEQQPYYNIDRVAVRPHIGESRERIMRYHIDREIAQCKKYYRDLAACERLYRAILLADKFTAEAILFETDNPGIGGEIVRRTFCELYGRAKIGKWPWGKDDGDYYQWFTIAHLTEAGWFEILSATYRRWDYPAVKALAEISDEDLARDAIMQDYRLEYRSREMERAY